MVQISHSLNKSYILLQTPAHFDEDFSEIIKKEAEESGISITCSASKEPAAKARTSLSKRIEDENMELVVPSLFNIQEELPVVQENSTVNVTNTVSSKTDVMVSFWIPDP